MLSETPENLIKDFVMRHFLKYMSDKRICDLLILQKSKLNFREIIEYAMTLKQIDDFDNPVNLFPNKNVNNRSFMTKVFVYHVYFYGNI